MPKRKFYPKYPQRKPAYKWEPGDLLGAVLSILTGGIILGIMYLISLIF